jgi:hypothetical protein
LPRRAKFSEGTSKTIKYVVEPERLILPADDGNGVPSFGDTANPGELKNDLGTTQAPGSRANRSF